jgi:hypothetical protein
MLGAGLGNCLLQSTCSESVRLRTEGQCFQNVKMALYPTGTIYHETTVALCSVVTCPGTNVTCHGCFLEGKRSSDAVIVPHHTLTIGLFLLCSILPWDGSLTRILHVSVHVTIQMDCFFVRKFSPLSTSCSHSQFIWCTATTTTTAVFTQVKISVCIRHQLRSGEDSFAFLLSDWLARLSRNICLLRSSSLMFLCAIVVYSTLVSCRRVCSFSMELVDAEHLWRFPAPRATNFIRQPIFL